jgi:CDP-glycerol glycerophosphotransferase
MIWHYLQVLRHEARVPPGSRRAFFRRMAESYQRFRPVGSVPQPTSRVERIRHRLVGRGSYSAFRLVDAALRWARTSHRVLRRRSATSSWIGRL